MSHVTHTYTDTDTDTHTHIHSLTHTHTHTPDIDQRESCPSHESCILSNVTLKISHVRHLNESCHTSEWVMSPDIDQQESCPSRGSCISTTKTRTVPWQLPCTPAYTYTFMYIHICVHMYIYTYISTHLRVTYFESETHNSTFATFLYYHTYKCILMYIQTYIYMYTRMYLLISGSCVSKHDSFRCVTCVTWDVRHEVDSFRCVSCHTSEWVTSHVTHLNESWTP